MWVANSDQSWMNGGTYQVVRKIRMLLETWEVDRIGNQEKIFGRGLLFVSYQNDPQNFIRLQNQLGAHDLLNEYIRHIGSAIFAVPPAPKQGHYAGQGLFS